MPAFLLKKIVLGNFAKGPVDPKMADAIDFMVDRVCNLGCQSALGMTLTVDSCLHAYVYMLNTSVCVFLMQLESLSQSELASRLTLNCQNSYVEPHKIKDVAVTIIDVSFVVFLKSPLSDSILCIPSTSDLAILSVLRCLIRAPSHWRPKKRCINCIPMLDGHI